MATLSTQSSPVVSPISSISSPSLNGIKKVLSTGRRSSEIPGELGVARAGFRSSVDSVDKSPSRKSDSSPSRDGSNKSGSSGIKKLLPGHAKRKRRKLREEELKVAAEEAGIDGREELRPPPQPLVNRSTTSLSHSHDGDSSLLTDESEPDTTSPPPLLSRESHTGYLTTSSPLITTTTIDSNGTDPDLFPSATQSIPIIQTPETTSVNVSPHSHPVLDSIPGLPMPGLTDKADTLRPDSDSRSTRRKSIGSGLRGVSPARKIREVFSSGRSTKSPRTSPERPIENFPSASITDLTGKTGGLSERRSSKFPTSSELSPVNTRSAPQLSRPVTAGLSALETDGPPKTPPSAGITTPLTTVTPPTPTDTQPKSNDGSPRRPTEAPQSNEGSSGTVVSPSGNMISHRRARSAASLSHQPSKLSNSVLAPSIPTIEESKTLAAASRNVTPGGNFFSSWVSAAQNAATTITNSINNQNTRSRSDTGGSEPRSLLVEETIKEESVQDEEETPKKQLAVETLGNGDLDFTHLGLDSANDDGSKSSLRPDLEDLRRTSTVRRDEAAAKIEDMLAKRAVSAAYGKTNDQTPVAEVPDPMNSIRHSQIFGSAVNGERTTPNGSIFEGETGSVKRNNSVRSRLTRRRSRGSSNATGHSTIGAALVNASTSTLANPARGPTLSGFAIAPKPRNRNFHQQFRSVPEDDYLIEDYSCALQRDILLAGRIYISEGHICFSSNILGWVTTLVISFEEVVSIERETTAMVFPNAIAIQTLHARHTFRSLLSREATYDLMIGIWKVSHPAAFKKSVNGRQLLEQEASRDVAKVQDVDDGNEDGSADDSEDVSDESDNGDGSASFVGSELSVTSPTVPDVKIITRKPSAMNGGMATAMGAPAHGAADAVATDAIAPNGGDATADYPGPLSHSPTECGDAATHYERVVKDEIIPAPLGKIYSLLYGPASGVFVRKYLLEEQKVTELVLEDDKKGLSNEIKSRQYTYIKPLGGSIGPKQTKCITTENLDFFDLDKSVSVTCTTQTPDVPSGNAFSVKTRYCLSWAPGNATRLQMNCGIEWTAKSWLKGPIEKGANDGQQSYGDGLVKVLKAGLIRPRATTAGSKGAKSGKKKRKGEKGERTKEKEAKAAKKQEEDWGIFEPAKGVLGPVVGILKPVMNGWVAFSVIVSLVLMLWFRRSATGNTGAIGFTARPAERLAAYEEMWRREESDLWDWLEDRVGIDLLRQGSDRAVSNGQKQQAQRRASAGRNVEARLREEKMTEREMEDAIRVTQERLMVLQHAVARQKQRREL